MKVNERGILIKFYIFLYFRYTQGYRLITYQLLLFKKHKFINFLLLRREYAFAMLYGVLNIIN